MRIARRSKNTCLICANCVILAVPLVLEGLMPGTLFPNPNRTLTYVFSDPMTFVRALHASTSKPLDDGLDPFDYDIFDAIVLENSENVQGSVMRIFRGSGIGVD